MRFRLSTSSLKMQMMKINNTGDTTATMESHGQNEVQIPIANPSSSRHDKNRS